MLPHRAAANRYGHNVKQGANTSCMYHANLRRKKTVSDMPAYIERSVRFDLLYPDTLFCAFKYVFCLTYFV